MIQWKRMSCFAKEEKLKTTKTIGIRAPKSKTQFSVRPIGQTGFLPWNPNIELRTLILAQDLMKEGEIYALHVVLYSICVIN